MREQRSGRPLPVAVLLLGIVVGLVVSFLLGRSPTTRVWAETSASRDSLAFSGQDGAIRLGRELFVCRGEKIFRLSTNEKSIGTSVNHEVKHWAKLR